MIQVVIDGIKQLSLAVNNLPSARFSKSIMRGPIANF
jgi:hypothetical protein